MFVSYATRIPSFNGIEISRIVKIHYGKDAKLAISIALVHDIESNQNYCLGPDEESQKYLLRNSNKFHDPCSYLRCNITDETKKSNNLKKLVNIKLCLILGHQDHVVMISFIICRSILGILEILIANQKYSC